MNMLFFGVWTKLPLIVIVWSLIFTNDLRLHLLLQTLKQTQIFVFIHNFEICYFRVEIPFGSKERFLADPISLAPSSLASVWENTFFVLFLSYSRISLIQWLDELFTAWKNKVWFIFIVSIQHSSILLQLYNWTWYRLVCSAGFFQ